MSVLIPTMIGKHHLKLDMPGEFSNKVLQKCLTTTENEEKRPSIDIHLRQYMRLNDRDKSVIRTAIQEMLNNR